MNIQQYKTFILENIYNSKINATPILKVYKQGQVIAYLKPISFDFKTTTPEICEIITKWKKQNPSISASIMQIDQKMTQQWIDKYILQQNDKLIFMIIDLNFQYIGYIGYASFDFQFQSCQIDSVLRGVKNIIPGLMFYSILTLVEYVFKTLKLKSLYLTTDSLNQRAIKLYNRVGFQQIYRAPLQLKYISPTQKRWQLNQQLKLSDKYKIKMKYIGSIK